MSDDEAINSAMAPVGGPGSPLADAWYLTGPTATGKTAAAIALAERWPVEVVALDSMTVYRGMEVGTAKPTLDERQRVPHHLIDFLDPHESSSVDGYLRRAVRIVNEIRERGRQPLLVGGTPLYLKAALRGLFQGPPADIAVRAALMERIEREGAASLHQELAAVDPAAAQRINENDARRIVRALEVHRLTGRPISSFQQQFGQPAESPPRVACLMRPRSELYDRINRRVVAMIDAGWLEETRQLLARQPPPSREARQAIGYAELARHLADELTLPQAVTLIQTRTRQFCKHQLTWFRHLPECVVMEMATDESSRSVADRLLAFYTAQCSP